MTTPTLLRLAVVVAGLALTWGIVLPWIGRMDAVEGHVSRMEQRGVNPAAMYYTELERLPLRPAWIEQRILLWPWLGAGRQER